MPPLAVIQDEQMPLAALSAWRMHPAAKSPRLLQVVVLASCAWAGMYSRAVLGPLQETVKSSLALSDNQMAVLQGTAMALPMVIG